MNARSRGCAVLFAGLMLLPFGIQGQTKEVTVPYLRGAAGALADRATVTLEAVYKSEPGLVEATGRNLKGKGYSRFTLRDPQSQGTFTSLYCLQDSRVFKELVGIEGTKMVRISGFKDYGEDKEAAIFVTGVEVLDVPVKLVNADGASSGGTFRIIIKDTTSGNRTVVANVVTGKVYKVDNLSVSIEAETPE